MGHFGANKTKLYKHNWTIKRLNKTRQDGLSINTPVQSKPANSSLNQSKPNWSGPVQTSFAKLLTIYISTRGRDLRHTEVGGADYIIVAGSIPGIRK